MRRVFAIIIVLCTLYFLGGWIGVHFGWLPKEAFSRDDYFAYAGIVGGLASVVGLFALTRPAISRSDVQAIELDSLKSMAKVSEELQTLETARSRAKGELSDLEVRKKEMELLVRKASLALFLKEQYAFHERLVLEEIAKNHRLQENLDAALSSSSKLKALNEEIETNPNVVQLKEIIASAERQNELIEAWINSAPFLTKSFLLGVRTAAKLAFPFKL